MVQVNSYSLGKYMFSISISTSIHVCMYLPDVKFRRCGIIFSPVRTYTGDRRISYLLFYTYVFLSYTSFIVETSLCLRKRILVKAIGLVSRSRLLFYSHKYIYTFIYLLYLWIPLAFCFIHFFFYFFLFQGRAKIL